MIETQEKIIGDCTFMVTQMTALRAVKMQARLLKLLGPSFATIISASDKASPDSCLPQAVSLLADKLDEKSFENLVVDLMQGVRKNGVEMTRLDIDMHFAGNLNQLFLLLQFILEVNFSDFFLEGGIIADLIKSSKNVQVQPDLKKT